MIINFIYFKEPANESPVKRKAVRRVCNSIMRIENRDIKRWRRFDT